MTDHNRDDERLRAVFDDLKDDDARARTAYASVVAHDMPKRTRLLASPVLRLAAATIVIVAATATYRTAFMRRPALTVPTEVMALMAWRAETDVLLESPVKLLRAQATPRASMIDLDTLTKGVLR